MVNLLSGVTPIRVFNAKKLPEAKSLVSDKSGVCVKLSISLSDKSCVFYLFPKFFWGFKKNNKNLVVF